MYKTGAQLVRYALEQLNIPHCFATLSDDNHAIYEQLSLSTSLNTRKVNHRLSAAFMADALSRTLYDGGAGAILISTDGIAIEGIAEAFISGIPLLIIAGSSPIDDFDARELLHPVTKACFKLNALEDIVSTIFNAEKIATSDKPGPVFVEIPVTLQSQGDKLNQPLPAHSTCASNTAMDAQLPDSSIEQIFNAENPCILMGYARVDAETALIEIADHMAAPVCTILESNSAFPATHPLHAGLVYTPAAKRTLKYCDCLLVIGADSMAINDLELPKTIVQLAPEALQTFLTQLKTHQPQPRDSQAIIKAIAKDKRQLRQDWLEHNSKGRVNPIVFFDTLANCMQSDAIVVTDYGIHRALTAELLPINNLHGFVSPSSAGAKGYCVPAVNAIKLASPDKQVIGIVGDGAMIINGMEVLTAVRAKLGTIYCLFNNSHQHIADEDTAAINWGAFTDAMDCGYFPVHDNHNIDIILRRAFETAAQGQPVILDVHIDYSRNSYFAEHQRKTQLARSAGRNTLSLVKQAIARKISG